MKPTWPKGVSGSQWKQMLPLTSYLLPSPLWPRPPLTDGSSVVAALLPSNLLGGIFAHVF